MATGDLNVDLLFIPQGSTWRRAWPILDSDTGLPQDLTGATARAQVRAYPSAELPLYEWTIDNEGIEIDTENSRIVLLTTPDVSNAWEWNYGYYDIVLTELSGDVTRIVQGTITVDYGITR